MTSTPNARNVETEAREEVTRDNARDAICSLVETIGYLQFKLGKRIDPETKSRIEQALKHGSEALTYITLKGLP